MVDRIESDDKGRMQLYLPNELIKRIKQAALDSDSTISKVVADAIERSGRIEPEILTEIAGLSKEIQKELEGFTQELDSLDVLKAVAKYANAIEDRLELIL